jgi:GNAT superfamily N-acetyltransferase
MPFTIDPVTPDDLRVLLELIRELARFEKLEDEVKATPETLNESFFGQTPVAGGLLARQGEQVVGYAIYFYTFSSFVGRRGIWLEDLYVRPQFRKQGFGRALIQAVAGIGVKHDCGRFEWTALNWNKPALEFYQKLGAQTLGEWVILRLNQDGLRHVANQRHLRSQ